MRLSIEYNIDGASALASPMPDPSAPNLSFLAGDVPGALRSFFQTIDRVATDNPVDIARLQELAGKVPHAGLTEAEAQDLQLLKVQALRQGRAVGATIGFFLKFRPYPMLEE